MKHVAALAGVGIKTVSRVMNKEPGVSEATQQKVLEATRQLNYQLDMAAGSLRRTGRQTLSLGLLLASVSNPFSAEIHRAIEDAAIVRGIAVFASSLDDEAERERPLVSTFLRRRVDGLILTTAAKSQAYLLPEINRNLPLVFIDREPVGIEADTVMTDNTEGAAGAARHLLAHGHRRLAYLGDRPDIQTAKLRRDGFMKELGHAGVATAGLPVVEGLHNEESAYRATIELLSSEEPPTAVFSSQNLVTLGVIRALRDRGANHRVALVGFDDYSLFDLLDPGVTVVAQHPERLGTLAAQRILARIDGDQSKAITYTVPSELIQRGSGELRPQQ
ncbi:LacI family DNA-binding transcriptional regulator [Paenarthrobacter sp. Z7-10]|uniref:LacI family DNA-binding transcriptional regulator n=1 Tax=Paenarthrobacter sp. Z7-10 TaxID=2787635 RepID=UPI0022A9F60D|nr:LacI family DNA-binding transcriptional regulator [Paenarthrobacter sp. Z7-10]MCZ2401611.1 LacI family DNA-binding transcriptional regulator [Paenarthrobacter sp. Z7-10]